MNRSWLIALITTVVLSAAVSLELRGLRRTEHDAAPAASASDGNGAAVSSASSRPEAHHLRPLTAPERRLESEGRPPVRPVSTSGGGHAETVTRGGSLFLRAAFAMAGEDPVTEDPRRDTEEVAVRDAQEDAATSLELQRLDAPHPQATTVTDDKTVSRLPLVTAADEHRSDRVARLPTPAPAMADDSSVSIEILPWAPPGQPRNAISEEAWWSHMVNRPQRQDSQPQPLDLAMLVQETILHSEHVHAVSIQVQVEETQIAQADAAFDPTAFIDSRWIDLSDPVGNVLTTGGPPRLSREEWTNSVGFRRKTLSGGSLEVAQRLGTEANNSIFFVPADQATSRLTLSLNQPLLRGGGRTFNRSLVLLAMHDTQIARDRFRSELEAHVLRAVRQYWELYYQRCVLEQQERALREAEEILGRIQARGGIDSLESQVKRARATVFTRKAHIVRAKAAIRNAESRLRALTNSPLLGGMSVELLPTEPLPVDEETLAAEDARRLALANRPEIDQALGRIRAVGVELGMSKNDMLPSLGLVLETYVSGLEGGFDIARSLGGQFSEGAPSYTAGLVFEMPLGRRRAQAFHQQKMLELKQADHIFRDMVATLSSEVEIALREVEASREELKARREAAYATTAEVETLKARRDRIPGEDHRAFTFTLEDLLNALDRLVRDEAQFAEAQRNYAVSVAEFYRATGMLVNIQSQP